MSLLKSILVSIAMLTNVAIMDVVLVAGPRQIDPPQSQASHEKSAMEQLHGVISRARLTPPLHSFPQQVRFSSDGEYLLVQLESGIYVINRRPLEINAWIDVPDILPARFSADSKTLIVATRSLALARWNLADKQKVDERILKTRDGCLASELSPHGELAACLDPSLALELYRTDTGERVFDQQVFTDQDEAAAGIMSIGLIPRNEGNAYAGPFGYREFHTLRDLADRESFGARLLFSPDAHFLLMLNRLHGSAVCVDVNAKRKIGCPGIIKERGGATICFAGPNQIAVLDPDHPDKSQVAEFPGGQLITKLRLAARTATPTTESKYLVVRSDKQNEARLFDWETDRTVKTQEQGPMDITGETLAAYSQQGELKLVHIADDRLEAKAILPAPLLPTLRVANVSPALDNIVLSIRGDAGLFRIATGNQIKPFTRLTGAWFARDDELYIAEDREDGSPAPIRKVNPKGETATETWSPVFKSDPRFTILDTHFGGPALFVLEQNPIYVLPDGHTENPGVQRKDKLRALNLKTGQELWQKRWVHHRTIELWSFAGVGQFPVRTWYDPPVPYADPQGERVAIGWLAMTSGGQALAKRYPALKRQLDAVKLTLNDAVFEVLEAASGKGVGTTLVRVGWGADSFDSVFSVGDFLICVRDAARVTVYSLSTGEIQARVFGHYISASAPRSLLAAADGNHLRLYSLKNGNKVDEYLFPDAPVYTQFSAAGNRLLVLTAQQVAYVLDLDGLNSSAGDHAGPVTEPS